MAIHRDQSAIEQYSIAIWFYVTATCYVAATLPSRWMIAAPPIAALSIQIVTGSIGLLGSLRANHLARNSVTLFGLMILASSWFAATTSPVCYVAWFFLAVVALNAIAWLVMIALRDSVRELEQRCGT